MRGMENYENYLQMTTQKFPCLLEALGLIGLDFDITVSRIFPRQGGEV